MRPTPEELLLSLRVSLNDGVLPHVADRWARYVGTAMDLVLQHLQARLAGELDAVQADNLDMAATLGALFGRARDGRWDGLLSGLPDVPERADASLAGATEVNEALRAQVVAVLHWLDDIDPADNDPDLRQVRDEIHRLIRRQLDRLSPLVEPLYMSFRPAAS